MDIKQLKHFLAVAEHQNFTRAAQAVAIAQPALSISIKKFEQQLGVQLFSRVDKQVMLTQEGRVLLPHAQKVLRQIDDASLAIDEMKGLLKGEVRLGTPSMMGSYFFPEIVMAFKSAYPNLKMTVIEAGTQDIRKMLLHGDIDLGVIRNTDVPDDLEVDQIFRSEMVAVVSQNHPFANKQSLDFDEFFDEELVMFKPGYFHRDFIDEECERRNIEAKFSFETNLLPMILSIVKREFAITALLELVTGHEPELKGLSFDPPVFVDLALAWRKDGYLSRADRTFIDFVKKHL
ncbi:HTH-type transcriptional regulator CynR [Vibrio mediterranei]|uniref:LysR family transcriptional regulator n=1 Tax=Vibrio mediterranei TaxID=689 RepID=A0ABX5DJ19_9VIBR|nr:LysR family transcriptional regulator [Vibrio mediterranei]MCG9628672.1 LysR family transcriptional regulator [Vibrio mediterranei]MCG9660556.1 LysR family transcriptional regulator [Vibrio mediterranei]MCG9664902.1 LysR family transcriptional regulator [Vibrio mediterranei]NOI21874.1 LysR family transcriptional regulator [Vibrio mediterranei]PCD90567.1 LysR family transcriptional regulator [Vibrio mediterranei]